MSQIAQLKFKTSQPITGGRRERQKQEVRGRIHQSAIQLLEEKGFEAMMVDELCEQANVARKTFYNYYSSKDELMQALSQSLFYAETANMIDMALENHSSVAQRLCFVFRSIGDALSQYEALERILLQYTLQNISFEDGRASQQLAQVNQAFERLFAQGEEYQLPVSKQLMTEMAVGMTFSMVLNWVNNVDYDLDSRIDELSQFLLKTLN